MSLYPSDPQAALADLGRHYGCSGPPGGQWYLRSPNGKLFRRADSSSASASAPGSSAVPEPADDDETLMDAHALLDALANAPADIAIVYGTDGHSRAVRIVLEIADTLARPL